MNRTYGMAPAMRATALILGVLAALSAFAADVYPTLPPVEFLDTEVVTNMSIPIPVQGGREYFFELAFAGSASNNVEIAFGEDADGDGVLSFEEVSLSAGWDCGEWFVENRTMDERISGPGGDYACELVGHVRLGANGRMREISFHDGASALFPALAASAKAWESPRDWNMVRLLGRGENVRTGERFHVVVTSRGLVFQFM